MLKVTRNQAPKSMVFLIMLTGCVLAGCTPQLPLTLQSAPLSQTSAAQPMSALTPPGGFSTKAVSLEYIADALVVGAVTSVEPKAIEGQFAVVRGIEITISGGGSEVDTKWEAEHGGELNIETTETMTGDSK